AVCNGSVTNQVTATANVLGCPTTLVRNAQATVACAPAPGLELSKTANQQSACAGATVGFVIHVHNTSTAPESVFFVDTFNGSPLTVNPIQLGAGASLDIPVTATMPVVCNGSITNSVTATANVVGCPQTLSRTAQ